MLAPCARPSWHPRSPWPGPSERTYNPHRLRPSRFVQRGFFPARPAPMEVGVSGPCSGSRREEASSLNTPATRENVVVTTAKCLCGACSTSGDSDVQRDAPGMPRALSRSRCRQRCRKSSRADSPELSDTRNDLWTLTVGLYSSEYHTTSAGSFSTSSNFALSASARRFAYASGMPSSNATWRPTGSHE